PSGTRKRLIAGTVSAQFVPLQPFWYEEAGKPGRSTVFPYFPLHENNKFRSDVRCWRGRFRGKGPGAFQDRSGAGGFLGRVVRAVPGVGAVAGARGAGL